MMVVYADVGVKENRRVHRCKRRGGNGEKGAALKTRHYKSVKDQRRERREGGLKSATEALRRKKYYKKMCRAPSATVRTSSARPLQKQREESSAPGYGALAAGTPRSAMLSPFLREGTALTWRTMAETGARGSAMSLPV